MAVLFAVVGIMLAQGGDTPPLKYFMFASVIMLLIAAYGTITQIRPQNNIADVAPSSDGGEPATAIRYGAVQFELLLSIMSCMALLFIGVAVEVYVRADGPSFPGECIVPALIGLFFGSYSLSVLRHRLRRGEVVISLNGIRQIGWSFESFLPWDSVIGVDPVFGGSRAIVVFGHPDGVWQRKYTTLFWRTEQLPQKPWIGLDCYKFAIDSVVLYHFVAFYVDNPQARGELGTDLAIERARSLAELGHHPERGPSS